MEERDRDLNKLILECYNKKGSMDPTDWYIKGKIHKENGELDKAQECFKNAAEKLYVQGKAYFGSGHYDEARNRFERIEKASEKEENICECKCYYETKEYLKTLRLAEEHYIKGEEYFSKGKYEEAKKEFEDVEGLTPGYKESQKYLANIEKIEEKLKKANEKFREAKFHHKTKKHPKDWPSCVPRQNVIQLCNEVLKTNSNDPTSLSILSEIEKLDLAQLTQLPL